MRHLVKIRKLSRTTKHRESLLANLVVSLIKHNRIKTSLAKAKAVRPLAEKVVTLGKKGTLHDRRLAIAKIGDVKAVSKLFKDIAPKFADRKGGYTRIIKIGPRTSDATFEAYIEWTDIVVDAPVVKPAKDEAKKEAAPAAAPADTKTDK
jgi:large subunit ribosomal protein L17